MLLLVVLLMVAEAHLRGQRRFALPVRQPRAVGRRPLAGWRAAAATVACALPVLLGAVLPIAFLGLRCCSVVSGSNLTPPCCAASPTRSPSRVWRRGLVVLLGVGIAAARRQGREPWLPALSRVAGLGYAVPGTVLALGLLVPLAAFDNLVADAARRWLGVNPGLLLIGSGAALVLAYLVRFLAIAVSGVESGLSRISPRIDDAARTLGASAPQVMRQMHWPLARPAVAAAALLVFVDCLKELPATLCCGRSMSRRSPPPSMAMPRAAPSRMARLPGCSSCWPASTRPIASPAQAAGGLAGSTSPGHRPKPVAAQDGARDGSAAGCAPPDARSPPGWAGAARSSPGWRRRHPPAARHAPGARPLAPLQHDVPDTPFREFMTRRASILAYSLLLVLGLLGLQSWNLAAARVERHVIRAIESRTGLAVTGLEKAEIALLPLPRISLSDVAFAQPDGGVSGRALRLRAQARLLPLLVGRLDFDRIDLVSPQLDLAVAPGSDHPGEWLSRPLDALQKLGEQSRIVIGGGSVFVRAEGAIRSILRDVNLVIDERDAQAPLALAGRVNWRGTPAEISLVWPMAGGRGRTLLSVEAPLLKLQFEGSRSSAPEPIITGQLTLATRSMPELLAWFGETPRLAAALGPLSLTAEARIRPHDTALTNVALRLEATGSTARSTSPPPRAAAASRARWPGRRWTSANCSPASICPPSRPRPRRRLCPSRPGRRRTSICASRSSRRGSTARASPTSPPICWKEGSVRNRPAARHAYGGSVKGRLLAMTVPGGIDVKLVGGVERLNLGRAGADLPQLARLTGIGTMQFGLDGLGRSVPEILASLTGKGTVSLRQGELAGFAFADLLRRAERNPGLGPARLAPGPHRLRQCGFTATVANGQLTLSDAQMAGAGYRMTLVGTAALSGPTLDMAALLQPASGPLRLPFSLKGPLSAPAFELQTDALLRPAGAAEGETLPLR